jgi:hypothetical protein
VETEIRDAIDFHLEGMREDGLPNSSTFQPGRVRRSCGVMANLGGTDLASPVRRNALRLLRGLYTLEEQDTP